MAFETILVEQRAAVTLVTLDRPRALNALNRQVLADLSAAMAAYDADAGQRCLVLTGSEKAFAAGADIKEMSGQGFAEMYGAIFSAGTSASRGRGSRGLRQSMALHWVAGASWR